MSRVEFFEVRGRNWESALCEQAEEAFAEGERIYVWAASEARARELDDLLWTFRDDAFIPHGLWEGEERCDEVVAVGWKSGNPNRAGCLILARAASPEEISAFERVLDFAPVDDPDLRNLARARFRAFREAGHQLVFHTASP